MTRSMYDCLFLPTPAPAGFDVAAGYLPSPGISRPWDLATWWRAADAARWLLPIAGYWRGATNAAGDAGAQRAELDRIGFPRGVARALDVEAPVANERATQDYARAWVAAVHAAGDWPMIYTSLSFAGPYRSMAPIWAARWNNQPTLEPGTVATQYASPSSKPGIAIDLNVIAESVPVWDHAAHKPKPPTAPAVPAQFSPAAAFVSWCSFVHPTLGHAVAAVKADGAVFCEPANAYEGGALGKPYFKGRRAARITAATADEAHKYGAVYTITASSGEKYHYPGP